MKKLLTVFTWICLAVFAVYIAHFGMKHTAGNAKLSYDQQQNVSKNKPRETVNKNTQPTHSIELSSLATYLIDIQKISLPVSTDYIEPVAGQTEIVSTPNSFKDDQPALYYKNTNIRIMFNNTPYDAAIRFGCQKYDFFDSVEIYIPTSPIIINKVVEAEVRKLNIAKYFTDHGFIVNKLAEGRYFKDKKALWELKRNDINENIFMVSVLSHGASGKYGMTLLTFFYNKQTAYDCYNSSMSQEVPKISRH